MSSSGASGVDTDGVLLMEGDSSLYTLVLKQTNKTELDGISMTLASLKSLETSVRSVQMFSVMKVLRDSETD